MLTPNHDWFILLAAGEGRRFKKSIQANRSSVHIDETLAKQFQPIGHASILEYGLETAKALQETLGLNILVVLPEDQQSKHRASLDMITMHITAGGDTRAQSCLNALTWLQDKSPNYVLVHDAARPNVHVDDVKALYQRVKTSNADEVVGGLLAKKITSTVKKARDVNGAHVIDQTIARDMLYEALTPQMFFYQSLFEALRTMLTLPNADAVTDEASAIELFYKHNQKPFKTMLLHESLNENPKITTLNDWKYLDFLLQQP